MAHNPAAEREIQLWQLRQRASTAPPVPASAIAGGSPSHESGTDADSSDEHDSAGKTKAHPIVTERLAATMMEAPDPEEGVPTRRRVP